MPARFRNFDVVIGYDLGGQRNLLHIYLNGMSHDDECSAYIEGFTAELREQLQSDADVRKLLMSLDVDVAAKMLKRALMSEFAAGDSNGRTELGSELRRLIGARG